MLSPQHLTALSERSAQVCRSPATICFTVIASQAARFVEVVVCPFGHAAHWRSVVAVPSALTWLPGAQSVHGLQGVELLPSSSHVFGPQLVPPPSAPPPSDAPASPLAPATVPPAPFPAAPPPV